MPCFARIAQGVLAASLMLTAGVGMAQTEPNAAPGLSAPSLPRLLPGFLQEPKPPVKNNYELVIEAPAELLAPIKTRTLIGRWQSRADYDPIQFDGLFARSKNEVETLMQAAGFFSGSVEVSGDSKSVKIEVDGGARTTVNLVELKITGPANEEQNLKLKRFRDQVFERWSLPEGTFFNAEFWEQSKRRLLETFQQKGYLKAKLTNSEARVDIENTTVSLRLEVDSGEVFHFGKVKISGLERYHAEIVQDLSPFKEGERYDFERLALFQQRLRQSGYFATANVLPDLLSLDADEAKPVNGVATIPIQVEVSEFKAKRVVVGVGVSSDQGLRGQLGFEHRNLFGMGWQLETALLVEQKRQRGFANLRTPIDEEGHYWGLGARVERLRPTDAETTLRSNVYLGRGRRVEDIEYFLSLQHQKERQDLITAGVSTRDYRQAVVASYAWNLRRLDSRIDPRDGYTISAQASVAIRGAGSDTSFSRLYVRGTRFWPLEDDSPLKGSTLIGFFEFGQVFAPSSDDIPSENLFRTGGSQALRGYRYLELGPTAKGLTVGGRSLAVASLEYQRPISQALRWAAFIDLGNATESFSSFKPSFGIGGGLRIKTPIGPVSADLAYGQSLRQFVFHFSVGYVF
jgi:translocation and assembly module TamA